MVTDRAARSESPYGVISVVYERLVVMSDLPLTRKSIALRTSLAKGQKQKSASDNGRVGFGLKWTSSHDQSDASLALVVQKFVGGQPGALAEQSGKLGRPV